MLEHGYLGFLSDIWSCGVCLYAMVYGNVPYKIVEITQVTRQLLEQKIEYKTPVSDACIDLMKKILVLDPQKRLKAW